MSDTGDISHAGQKSLRFLVLIISGIFISQPFLVSISAAEKKDEYTITIDHKPITYFVPRTRYRIEVTMLVTDPTGVKLARCYFRAEDEADFLFVPMQREGEGIYKGVIPTPHYNSKIVEYLLLVMNNKNQIYKTKTFVIKRKLKKKIPPWQFKSSDSSLIIHTEQAIPGPLKEIPGFRDNITLDTVESALRFGGTGTVITQSSSEIGGVNAYWQKEFGTAVSKKPFYTKFWFWSTTVIVVGGGAAAAYIKSQEKEETASVSVGW